MNYLALITNTSNIIVNSLELIDLVRSAKFRAKFPATINVHYVVCIRMNYPLQQEKILDCQIAAISIVTDN